jgi:hypothetical protein
MKINDAYDVFICSLIVHIRIKIKDNISNITKWHVKKRKIKIFKKKKIQFFSFKKTTIHVKL